MKRTINILIIISFTAVAGFIYYKESGKKNEDNELLFVQPTIENVIVERRIHGKILPSEEINVKSKINGIIDSVYIEVGDKVVQGQKIAIVRNLSEPMDIENLKSAIKVYEIQLQNAKVTYERDIKLSKSGLTASIELEKSEAEYYQIFEQLESAKKKMQMATSGISTVDKDLSNVIYAPASGTVLSLFSKPGSPVIKQNSFSEGTTVATIADMGKMKYYGSIPECYLTDIYEGQSIAIETLINEQNNIYGTIDKIYPKGNDKNGTVRFPIEAKINPTNKRLWGGINATAVISIAEADSVLCLNESSLIYSDDSCFVLKFDNGGITKTPVEVGLSDGIKTEIKSGLSLNDRIKLSEYQ